MPVRDIPHYVELYRAGQLPVDALMGETVTFDGLNAAFDKLATGHAMRMILKP